MTEDVMRQKHYTELPIQPIVVMLKDLPPEQFMGFLKGNVIKYVLRAELKNGTEDYAKAMRYAQWMAEFAMTGTITVPGQTERMDKVKEVHHFYSASGSDETADAKCIVDLLDDLLSELRGADR
jgi:hypothetical protein